MRAFAAVAITFAFFLNSPAACAEKNPVEQLRWIEKANPATDAEAALKINDHTLLAVRGYTWVIPGTDESKKLEYKTRYGVRLILGTSDTVISEEHLRLIRLATDYAENYNRYLLKRLDVH